MRIEIPILLVMAVMVAGCGATAAKNQDPAPPADVVDNSTSSGSESTTFGLDDQQGGVSSEEFGNGAGASGAMADEQDLLSQRSIYFEYDSDLITEDYRMVIEAHARFLNDHPSLSISLEGHADERGSREYNLALGEKRSLAVGRMFSLLGLSQSRINSLSYGEERPQASGGDEASWRLNRRVDLVY